MPVRHNMKPPLTPGGGKPVHNGDPEQLEKMRPHPLAHLSPEHVFRLHSYSTSFACYIDIAPAL